MKIKEYLARYKIPQQEFALRAHISPKQLSNVILGYARAGGKVAKKIHEASNGEISFEEIFDIPLVSKKAKD